MNDPDQLQNGKSIYEVSKTEIFWRNFLAGFARGLGNFLFTIIVFVIITVLTAQILSPYMGSITQSMTSLSGIINTIYSAQPRTTR